MARKPMKKGSTDAVSIAAFVLMTNLLHVLSKKRLLDQQEHIDVIEGALSDAELLSLDYDEVALSGARAALELLMKTQRGEPPPT